MTPRPLTLRVAAGLVTAEAAALLTLGLVTAVLAFAGDPDELGWALFLAAMALLSGGLLFAVARGLGRTRRWARAPAVLAQLFVLVVAYEPLQRLPVVRILLIAVALIALFALLAPTTDKGLSED